MIWYREWCVKQDTKKALVIKGEKSYSNCTKIKKSRFLKKNLIFSKEIFELKGEPKTKDIYNIKLTNGWNSDNTKISYKPIKKKKQNSRKWAKDLNRWHLSYYYTFGYGPYSNGHKLIKDSQMTLVIRER